MATKNEEGLRIDLWLWFTRFYKTRSLASKAVQAGHVHVNGTRAKSGNRVLSGDTVEIVKNQLRHRLNVIALPSRRGPASEMIKCFEVDAGTRQQRLELTNQLREDRRQMPRTRGKPDKHTRRLRSQASRQLKLT